MNMPMCSRCKKNIAVVFITKIEGPDKTTQEGLCLKCARELGVKPLDNIMDQMGITEDDLEALSGEISSLADLNDLVAAGADGSDDDAPHETDPLSNPPAPSSPRDPQSPLRPSDGPRTRTQAPPRDDKKRKYLNNYCENLTRKAAEGRIDHIVGRDRENRPRDPDLKPPAEEQPLPDRRAGRRQDRRSRGSRHPHQRGAHPV